MKLRRKAALIMGAILLTTGLATGSSSAASAPGGGEYRVLDSCLVSPTHPTLRYGATGPAVYHAQCIMRQYASQDIAVDGKFGPETWQAVANVQRVFGLKVDGIVGPQTWGALHYLAP